MEVNIRKVDIKLLSPTRTIDAELYRQFPETSDLQLN